MNGGAPKSGDNADRSAEPSSTSDGEPGETYIRELGPTAAHVPEGHDPTTTGEAGRKKGRMFPTLRSVARFLTLESYRSLPKHDKLPDLGRIDAGAPNDVPEDDSDFEFARLEDLEETPEPPGSSPQAQANESVDWDEMDIEELPPNPYLLYLFDARIEKYLQTARRQLSQYLIED